MSDPGVQGLAGPVRLVQSVSPFPRTAESQTAGHANFSWSGGLSGKIMDAEGWLYDHILNGSH